MSGGHHPLAVVRAFHHRRRISRRDFGYRLPAPLVARFDPRELRLIARDGEGTMNGMLDVAVTGVGVVSAIGLSAEEFHRQLMADASGIRRAPWAADGEGEAVWLATARGFVPRDWMDERVE